MDTAYWRRILDDYDRATASIRGLNATREIHLALIESHRFNGFDGPRIAADLRAHRDRWLAAYHGPADAGEHADYMRRLARGENGADTLHLLVPREWFAFWRDLAYAPRGDDERDTWGADEEPGVAMLGEAVLLRLWWD